MKLRVIELFSGIGGMHYALQDSGLEHEVIAAADINTHANSVYRHNFDKVSILQTNIQSLTADYFNNLNPDMIVMSPPCQPFTRVGLKKDAEDSRTCSLLKFITVLPDLTSSLKYILLENVQGFEQSHTRSMLLEALTVAGFQYQEILLSPSQFNIPNSRTRYYLIAKRTCLKFIFNSSQSIMDTFPEAGIGPCLNVEHEKNKYISDFLEVSDNEMESYNSYLVQDKVLKRRIKVFDVVTKSDTRSLCFTKGYSRFAEGTGSVYSPYDRQTITSLYEKSKSHLDSPCERLSILREMRLRYFSPKEVANLLCFPKSFELPQGVTLRQCYRLLGNSINVHVVGKLLTILCAEPQDNSNENT